MANRLFHVSGLFAVLLALMAQLGMGASAPRIDPVAMAEALCHTDGDTPAHAPGHPADCDICPLCAALHGSAAVLLPAAATLAPKAVVAVVKAELPPPSTAPPAPPRPPNQPRAPPTTS
jgi:hypothetical protein